jgi:hypothetical protein
VTCVTKFSFYKLKFHNNLKFTASRVDDLTRATIVDDAFVLWWLKSTKGTLLQLKMRTAMMMAVKIHDNKNISYRL